jgi:hypothetical protein
MPRRFDLRAELPPPGPARAFVILSLALGGAVAVGLSALIAVFLYTSLTS